MTLSPMWRSRRAAATSAPMRLFFYGVLLGEVASPAIRTLLAGLGHGERATTQGTLFAVPDPAGWYPVLLDGKQQVTGALHEAGMVDLAALDRFEGVDPADPRAGEYRRAAISVTGQTGLAVSAHAYLYNHAPGPGFVPIGHGDFARWLRETGNRPLAAR